MMYYDDTRLCTIRNPPLCNQESDDKTTELRGDYATITLMKFIPFRICLTFRSIEVTGNFFQGTTVIQKG